MLAQSARVPVGFEEVSQEPQEYDGNLAKVSTEDKTTLLGLTIGRALDALVAVDPRYAWREQDGVLITRPVDAWRDRTHFLNEIVGPIYEGSDAPSTSLKALRSEGVAPQLVVRRCDRQPDTEGKQSRPADLSDASTSTMLGVLNAIAKSHGQLGLLSSRPRAERSSATAASVSSLSTAGSEEWGQSPAPQGIECASALCGNSFEFHVPTFRKSPYPVPPKLEYPPRR